MTDLTHAKPLEIGMDPRLVISIASILGGFTIYAFTLKVFGEAFPLSEWGLWAAWFPSMIFTVGVNTIGRRWIRDNSKGVE